MGATLGEISEDHYVGLAGYQLPVNATAIAMGYSVRVGIEDNIWWDGHRTSPCTNIDLIKRIHELINLNQIEFITAREFGEIGFKNEEGRR